MSIVEVAEGVNVGEDSGVEEDSEDRGGASELRDCAIEAGNSPKRAGICGGVCREVG